MADETPPATGWLLIRRGYYWRPDAAGYTSNVNEAGRYSYDDALDAVRRDGSFMIHESDIENYEDRPRITKEVRLVSEEECVLPKEATDAMIDAAIAVTNIPLANLTAKQSDTPSPMENFVRGELTAHLRLVYRAMATAGEVKA